MSKQHCWAFCSFFLILGALTWLGIAVLNQNIITSFAGPYANYVYIVIGLCGVMTALKKLKVVRS